MLVPGILGVVDVVIALSVRGSIVVFVVADCC